MNKAAVFTFLVLWLTLVNTFGPKKNKAYCSVFVFCWDISTAICDLVLYLLFEGLKTLINDGVIPFQYLITVVAMQDSSISETGSQFVFPKS